MFDSIASSEQETSWVTGQLVFYCHSHEYLTALQNVDVLIDVEGHVCVLQCVRRLKIFLFR